MVLDYYNLREQPFGTTPDSRYLFESETHREALASLLYGVEAGRGFIALIAKPGMGKTTLLFRSLKLLGQKSKTVFLCQTICTPLDFLRALLADLGVEDLQGGVFELQAKLNEILVEQSRRGERLIVAIDETQNLDESVLELLRMLSNFETPQGKLMQIILSGQPQLAHKLASPGLVQLRQRISIIARLRSFTPGETAHYVDHRLRSAGYSSEKPLFTAAALRLIAEHSEGIPRNINNLCFNALSLGCALKRRTIDSDIIREVIADLDLGPLTEPAGVVTKTSFDAALLTVRVKRPNFGAWLPRTAIASMALLVLSAVTFQSKPKATVLASVAKPSNVIQALSVVPPDKMPPVPAAANSSPDVIAQRLSDIAREQSEPETITVQPGFSLYRICTETFKTCHPKDLKEIRRLNPWLKHPGRLKPGQELRIPSRQQLAADTQSPLNTSSNKATVEVTTQ
jgi:general secretion pathway protein A